nr:DUF1801 domain-containing protein [Kibdelosporangium sp. MJ126-NF4]CEL15649.1 FIG00868433: hypothetical protein [Kibdelosporangium sp. MJ126-NF4]CTQ90312.1 FIG00868433: hypothetical protein [Kibdelosporangium sp. MJ126-NF4]
MATTKNYDGFTEDERGAMKERAKELKAGTRRSTKADPENDVLAKIAEMTDSDRVIAEKLHALIKANAPELTAKLWYGMPAYARNGKIVCHFQPSTKFKTRYATLGFSDEANLDDGVLWASTFAVAEMTAKAEARIAELVRQAVS